MSTIEYISDVAKLPEHERRSAYFRWVGDGRYRNDDLEKRISGGVPLSEPEIESVIALLCTRCTENTRGLMRHRLAHVAALPSYGIFGRVMFEGGEASYCAGQDYPSEIRRVRALILKGK